MKFHVDTCKVPHLRSNSHYLQYLITEIIFFFYLEQGKGSRNPSNKPPKNQSALSDVKTAKNLLVLLDVFESRLEEVILKLYNWFVRPLLSIAYSFGPHVTKTDIKKLEMAQSRVTKMNHLFEKYFLRGKA